MPRIAANLTMLFTEHVFLERFAAAHRAGFTGVEFQFPYAWPARDIKAQLDQYGLIAVLHNLPAGNWELGERGIACHPGRVQEFRQGVTRALEYAQTLGIFQLNCLMGLAPPGASAQAMKNTAIENLRFAAQTLKTHGMRLLVEPLNTFDLPGFWLHSTTQALRLIDEVGVDNLFLQYDIYHMQRMEGEIANTLGQHLDRIGHIQIADTPGRHEPGTGELNFPFLLQHIDSIGYTGWVGAEYHPQSTTQASLGWMQTLVS